VSQPATWSFLTNYARVLICIARDPGIRLREIGDAVGITERAAHRIMGELAAAGYVSRERVGRRNHYTVRTDLPVPDSVARDRRVGELLAILTAGADDEPEDRRAPVYEREPT
jgi:predicted ArsR family transcriptional regulator